MFSFLIIYFIISIIAGISSLIDRKFLGLIVHRTGPTIGYGFLTIFGDGFKLISKNPWISYFLVIVGFFIYGFETISLNIVFYNQDVSIILIVFLGFSGSVITIASYNFYRGYSALGKYRSQIQILLGEGIFSLYFYIIIFLLCFDFLFYIEKDYIKIYSFYTFYIFYMSLYLLLLGERHPFDIPESESDLGGGLGVSFSGLYFVFFAILEYRWIFYFSIFCILSKYTLWTYLFLFFFLRGITSRLSYRLFIEQIWFYFPLIIKTWLFYSFLIILFCFLLFK